MKCCYDYIRQLTSCFLLGKPNELQGEDLLPVFSAIASRRDLIDKKQKEEDGHGGHPIDRELAEENRFETHRKLTSLEKVVARLQTVIAYYEEAHLRRDQEIAENRRIFLLKEMMRDEEENVRVLVSHNLY